MRRYKNLYLATSTLIGTIIGVGIFGIPYVVAQSGFWLGLVYLVGLGLIITVINLFYAEIILRTKGQHRLIGYTARYLGRKGKIISTVSTVFGLYGSLLAYLIVGGKFLHILLGPWLGGTSFIYSLVLFSLGALAIFRGLKLVARGELVMTIFLLLTVVLLLLKGWPHINYSYLANVNWDNFFLPYGVILFALIGLNALPEIKGILGSHKKYFREVVIIGTLIPVIIYVLFTLVMVGVTGSATTTEAMTGFINTLGNGTAVVGALFGFLAVTTSFLVLGLNLKESFCYDYKLPHGVSWFLACSVPLILFLTGFSNFIQVIGWVGTITGGLNGIIVVLIYWQATKRGRRQPEFSLNLPRLVGYLIMLIFIMGIVYEIIY